MYTKPSSPNLLDLPIELLRRIIWEALLSEIEERKPRPFGIRSLPFDRPLLAVIPDVDTGGAEYDTWHEPRFWGMEPMTRRKYNFSGLLVE
jgi:hypothetical protein